jgi:hypothetical protein
MPERRQAKNAGKKSGSQKYKKLRMKEERQKRGKIGKKAGRKTYEGRRKGIRDRDGWKVPWSATIPPESWT